MKLNFDRAGFTARVERLREGVKDATEDALTEAMEQAADDARGMKRWRDAGTYEEDYGDHTWKWTVTGLAAASIQGFVIGRGRLKTLYDHPTTSFYDGMALHHPHGT